MYYLFLEIRTATGEFAYSQASSFTFTYSWPSFGVCRSRLISIILTLFLAVAFFNVAVIRSYLKGMPCCGSHCNDKWLLNISVIKNKNEKKSNERVNLYILYFDFDFYDAFKWLQLIWMTVSLFMSSFGMFMVIYIGSLMLNWAKTILPSLVFLHLVANKQWIEYCSPK